MGPENKPRITTPNLFSECGVCAVKDDEVERLLTSKLTTRQQSGEITQITLTCICDADEGKVQMLRQMIENIQFVQDGPHLDIPGGDFPREPKSVDCPHFPIKNHKPE